MTGWSREDILEQENAREQTCFLSVTNIWAIRLVYSKDNCLITNSFLEDYAQYIDRSSFVIWTNMSSLNIYLPSHNFLPTRIRMLWQSFSTFTQAPIALGNQFLNPIHTTISVEVPVWPNSLSFKALAIQTSKNNIDHRNRILFRLVFSHVKQVGPTLSAKRSYNSFR